MTPDIMACAAVSMVITLWQPVYLDAPVDPKLVAKCADGCYVLTHAETVSALTRANNIGRRRGAEIMGGGEAIALIDSLEARNKELRTDCAAPK